jgi:beta-barrel assembly-enhancing protease
MFHVWHYDGGNGRMHSALVEPADGGFRLVVDGISGEPIAWDRLEPRGHRNGAAVYGLKDVPGWQIGFDGGVPAELAGYMPRELKYGRWIDRFGFLPALVTFAAISAGVVALVLRLPDWIAPNIPMSFEKRLGEAMVGDLSGNFCRGKAGEDALAALVRRVDPQGSVADVHVVRFPAINAITLPGGTILIFDGLLRSAASPEEIAGVLGHEIGHVRHRDVMQALVRQAGLSVILGGFSGNIGGNMESLLSASFSRDAESAADRHSIEAMVRANVDPRDTAAFFKRLSRGQENVQMSLAFLASHPAPRERAERFERSAVAKAEYAPALTQEQWGALADLCHNDPNQKGRRPFGF